MILKTKKNTIVNLNSKYRIMNKSIFTVYILLLLFLLYSCNSDDSGNQENDSPSLANITIDPLFTNFVEDYSVFIPEMTDIRRSLELGEIFDSLSNEQLEEFYQVQGFGGRVGFRSFLDNFSENLLEIDEKYGILSLEKRKRDSIFGLGIENAYLESEGLKQQVTCMNLSIDLYNQNIDDQCAECFDDLNRSMLLRQSSRVEAWEHCRELANGDSSSETFYECFEATGFPTQTRADVLLFACCLTNNCKLDPVTEEIRCDNSSNEEDCTIFLTS